MGSGGFSLNDYQAAAQSRRASGQSDFGYTDQIRNVSRHLRKAHDDLNVHGVTLREARDSDEHPESTPIVVLFDVTGSMGSVPRTVQKQLGELFDTLSAEGFVTDPQIMVGAVGDDQYDMVPIQIGQFESDNRVDEQLRNIYLEGGGGGDKREGYALAAHFINTRVKTDAWEKRGHKGYVFIIGDELNKDQLYASSLTKWLGEEANEDLNVEKVYEDLKEKWDVFYILPNLTSYYNDKQIEDHWVKLVGERFSKLPDPNKVTEFIAETVALHEQAKKS